MLTANYLVKYKDIRHRTQDIRHRTKDTGHKTQDKDQVIDTGKRIRGSGFQAAKVRQLFS